MAAIARVWNAEPLGLGREDEPEGVTADVDVGNGLFDLRHVAGHALAPSAAGLMMSVLLYRRGVRTVGRTRAVALQAHDIGRFYEVGGIGRPVDVVTTEARHTVCVHFTCHKIVSLHPRPLNRRNA